MSSNGRAARDIYVSTTSFQTRDLPEIFALCEANGLPRPNVIGA